MLRTVELSACALAAVMAVTGCAGGADRAPPREPAPAAVNPTPMDSAPSEVGKAPQTREPTATATPTATVSPTPAESPAATATPTPTPEATGDAGTRPEWLGTRPLEEGPDGIAPPQQTPDELIDRQLPPPSPAPLEPTEDDAFTVDITEVPAEVVERSTWSDECPVALDELRYLTVTYWGFDDQAHTGELLVHVDVADDLAGVFAQLYEARFPIEEMRVITSEELDAPPTGDGNVTTAFVCRPLTGASDDWSQHAYGLAVDINPFHNPYERDGQVVPELASAYTDREQHRPGMIRDGDAVVDAFTAVGWSWGGHWDSLRDPMHFSPSGR